MFQTSVLASGSKGNAILIRTDKTKLLYDAGLSGKRIFEAINKLQLNQHRIAGLILSHEHSDHSKGVGVVCRNLNIPLYVTQKTFFECRAKLGNLPGGPRFFEPGKLFQIGDIVIYPFTSSHDAVDSCDFLFYKEGDNERKLGVVTDVGFPTKLMLKYLKNCSTIILESNHDMQMLMDGPYPWKLKQRVRSRHGHLSNVDAVKVVDEIMHEGLKNLILAHLSETNNTPEIAFENMNRFLTNNQYDVKLLVADQYEPTILVDI